MCILCTCLQETHNTCFPSHDPQVQSTQYIELQVPAIVGTAVSCIRNLRLYPCNIAFYSWMSYSLKKCSSGKDNNLSIWWVGVCTCTLHFYNTCTLSCMHVCVAYNWLYLSCTHTSCCSSYTSNYTYMYIIVIDLSLKNYQSKTCRYCQYSFCLHFGSYFVSHAHVWARCMLILCSLSLYMVCCIHKFAITIGYWKKKCPGLNIAVCQ